MGPRQTELERSHGLPDRREPRAAPEASHPTANQVRPFPQAEKLRRQPSPEPDTQEAAQHVAAAIAGAAPQ